jgi:DNA polymerase bacteriophage-type
VNAPVVGLLRPPEPTLDFETYSEAGFVWVGPGVRADKPLGYWTCLPGAPQGKKGLNIVGASVYTEHPTARVLSLSYDIGQGLRRWRPGLPLPQDLFDYLASGGTIEAHYAMFERLVWENICVPKYGFPPLNPPQLRCSMATARVNCLPASLENLGDVLEVPTRKDADGKRLLNKFSIPRNPTKTDPRVRILPDEEPDEAERLYRYNDTDVVAEQGCASRMSPMTAAELYFWIIDQEINHRGLGIDRPAVRDCIAVLEEALAQYGRECEQITGGLQSSQLAQIQGWLAGQGVHLPDMQAETIETVLAGKWRTWSAEGGWVPLVLPPLARRVLEIRSLVGSASVKKLYAMEHQASADDRLRNLIVHHGARTGRPTGEGPQPLNLPKAGPKLVTCGACRRPHKPSVDVCPWCGVPCPPIERKARWAPEMVPHVLEIMAARSLGLVEWFFGDALLAISGCIRGLFVADEGNDLIASDYSAIEAVVAAMIAGEQWRIDTFRAGIDIYLASASKITGTPLQDYLDFPSLHGGDNHPDRQKVGKIAELALGFGGWEGAWRAFDPDSDSKSTAEIEAIIRAWRNASPQIVAMWGGQRTRTHVGWMDELYGIEGAIIRAIRTPGSYEIPNPPSDGQAQPFPVNLGFYVHDDILHLVLPSGRALKYHQPRLEASDKRPGTLAISYMTWNSNPKYGPVGWVRMSTWGSRVFENAVQAIAHDILRGAIIRLRAAGYPTVLHVYDEIVGEIPIGTGSIEEFERLMLPTEPEYAGWPIRATGGWRGRRYRKG